MLYGYFGMDNKVSAELYYSTSGYGLNPKNFKPKDKNEEDIEVRERYVYYDKKRKLKFEIIVNYSNKKYDIRYENDTDNTTSITREELVKGIKEGSIIRVLDEEKEEITFKTGDKFLVKGRPDKIFELGLIAMGQVTIITPDMGEVQYSLTEVKQRFESGAWTKVIDEEKEGGTEEDIKKAIAALEILAEDGDEDAKKGIEALKILLN